MEPGKAKLTPELAGNTRTQLERALRDVYKVTLAREPLSNALAIMLLQIAVRVLLRWKRGQELAARGDDEPNARSRAFGAQLSESNPGAWGLPPIFIPHASRLMANSAE